MKKKTKCKNKIQKYKNTKKEAKNLFLFLLNL
mgnify:CR=1 FL=1